MTLKNLKMVYSNITDEQFTQMLQGGFPTLARRMTADELRWLWEHYDISLVDKAMFYLEMEGCVGSPFDEVKRLLKRIKK